MGRWRSGAPLVLSPDRDDPALGADLQRNNDFNYGEMDPHGYACPIGSHVRRMNPRDTAENMQRRKMIRRGGTYGPPLPDGAPEDGAERGIAAFVGCASLVRQFEFAMNVWANDATFGELGNERDPIYRNARRDVRPDDSEAADPEKNKRAARVYHAARRRIFLPARHPGARFLAADASAGVADSTQMLQARP